MALGGVVDAVDTQEDRVVLEPELDKTLCCDPPALDDFPLRRRMPEVVVPSVALIVVDNVVGGFEVTVCEILTVKFLEIFIFRIIFLTPKIIIISLKIVLKKEY